MTTDPYAALEIGDDDPIGAFDETNICGATTQSYPGERHRVECLREPHPFGWLHVSTCDDVVDYAWRDLTAAEVESVVITSGGVTCRSCGIERTTDPSNHYAGCSFLQSEGAS